MKAEVALQKNGESNRIGNERSWSSGSIEKDHHRKLWGEARHKGSSVSHRVGVSMIGTCYFISFFLLS